MIDKNVIFSAHGVYPEDRIHAWKENDSWTSRSSDAPIKKAALFFVGSFSCADR